MFKVLNVLTVLVATVVIAVPVAAQMSQAPPEALEGLDPVLLTQGKEVAGQDKLALVHGRLKYFFASPETRAAFEKEPKRYAVQLDGTCARMGPGVVGNPNLYAVHEERIYLLGTPTCKERFEAAPARYLEPAPVVLEAKAPETKAARRLLDKAAAAMGALDRMTSFEERASRTLPAQGDMAEREMKTALLWALPHRLRAEMTFPDFGTVANVVTDSDAFVAMPRGVRSLDAPQVRELMRQAFLHPLVLLRARRSDRFRAAPGTPDRGAGLSGPRVNVQMMDGPVMTIAIDPASARPASVSYRGRGPEGDLGDIVISFSDYRDVAGVAIPFKRTATFNGAAAPALSVAVQSVDVDKPIDEARFRRPSVSQ